VLAQETCFIRKREKVANSIGFPQIKGQIGVSCRGNIMRVACGCCRRHYGHVVDNADEWRLRAVGLVAMTSATCSKF